MTTTQNYLSMSLSPSLGLLIFSIIVHALAVVAISYLSLLGWLQWLLQICLIIHLYCFIYQNYYLKRYFIERIIYNNQTWKIFIQGKSKSVVLQQVTVWSWMQVLNFRDELTGKSHVVLLVPGSAIANDSRQLKIILRHCVNWNQPKIC